MRPSCGYILIVKVAAEQSQQLLTIIVTLGTDDPSNRNNLYSTQNSVLFVKSKIGGLKRKVYSCTSIQG